MLGKLNYKKFTTVLKCYGHHEIRAIMYLIKGVYQVTTWTVRSFCLPSSPELRDNIKYKQV